MWHLSSSCSAYCVRQKVILHSHRLVMCGSTSVLTTTLHPLYQVPYGMRGGVRPTRLAVLAGVPVGWLVPETFDPRASETQRTCCDCNSSSNFSNNLCSAGPHWEGISHRCICKCVNFRSCFRSPCRDLWMKVYSLDQWTDRVLEKCSQRIIPGSTRF